MKPTEQQLAIAPLQSRLIFSDERIYRISRHVLFWLCWWIFFTLVYVVKPVGIAMYTNAIIRTSFFVSATEALFFLPEHLIFSYVILYFLIPGYLLQGRYFPFLLGIVAAMLLAGVLSYVISLGLVNPFRAYMGIKEPYNNFSHGLLAGLRGGVQTGGFAAAIKLMKHFYLKQQANQQLTQEKLKAELQLLKSQVHPHFLFNTLNNLYALTLTKSDEAPEIVLKLSGLLRYMLYECNTPKVPVEKEIALLLSYIELEKIRYGHRLDISLAIGGDTAGKEIAPLLLLPYVENSFKHGTSEQLDQAWISLEVQVKEDLLKFKLINSKASPEQPYSPENNRSAGIGLKNVQKRLDLIYPGQYELRVVSEAETFMVVLTLPLQLSATPALVNSNSTMPENQLTAQSFLPVNHENPVPVSR